MFLAFDNVFYAYLMSGLKKYAIFFSQWLFLNPLYPFWDAHGQAREIWKYFWNIILTKETSLQQARLVNINYLSIWPFMSHPWFPTRKASKLTFVGFQHQVLNTLQGLDNWSWKQINVSFEAFLVGNQEWHIKGQTLW